MRSVECEMQSKKGNNKIIFYMFFLTSQISYYIPHSALITPHYNYV